MVAVFPFFETNFPGNSRQRRLRMLAPYYELLGWVGAAVNALPEALRRGFVALNASMEPDARSLTARLLTRHVVRNAFYLAGHEFKVWEGEGEGEGWYAWAHRIGVGRGRGEGLLPSNPRAGQRVLVCGLLWG